MNARRALCRDILAALAMSPARADALASTVGESIAQILPRLRALGRKGLVRTCKVYPAGWKPRHKDEANEHGRIVWMLANAQPEGLEALLPKPPAEPARAPLAPPKRATPHKDTRPEPIEILARMAGRTTFRTPKQPGASTAISVTPIDIAHAMGAAKDRDQNPTDPLGAVMAMAMACQNTDEWLKVQRLGHSRVLAHLRAQRQFAGAVDAPYTYRARIALYDAFTDLVAPDKRRNLTAAAREGRMRRDVYRHLLRETTAYLEHAANTAAADAVRYLFALVVIEHPLTQRVRAVSTARGIQVWTSASAAEIEAENDSLCAYDINLLLQDMATARERRPGVLRLGEAK